MDKRFRFQMLKRGKKTGAFNDFKMCYDDDENGCGFGFPFLWELQTEQYTIISLNELFKNESMSTAVNNLNPVLSGITQSARLRGFDAIAQKKNSKQNVDPERISILVANESDKSSLIS